MINQPTILVTGSNGFIGSAFVRQATIKGYRITGLALNSSDKGNYEEGTEFLNVDINDLESLGRALAGRRFDYVVNCAGYVNHELMIGAGRQQIETHLMGLINLIACVRHDGLRGFVQLGSSDEYGGAGSPQQEDFREQPISPYSFAKTAASHYIQSLYTSERLPVMVARLFLVYGPNQGMQRFIPQIIKACLNNQKFPVSKGEQVRDFCFIDDVIQGILHLLQTEKAHGQIVNLASGAGFCIRDVVEKIRSMTGAGQPEYGKIVYRTGENMSLYANIDKLKALTNWQPVIDLDDGLKICIDWHRSSLG